MMLGSGRVGNPPLPIVIAAPSMTMTTPRDVIEAHAAKAYKDNLEEGRGGIQLHNDDENNRNDSNEGHAATT